MTTATTFNPDMRQEEAWQMIDAITTVVNACGHTVWHLTHHADAHTFALELTAPLDEEAALALCAQLPLNADFEGQGQQGARFTLYA